MEDLINVELFPERLRKSLENRIVSFDGIKKEIEDKFDNFKAYRCIENFDSKKSLPNEILRKHFDSHIELGKRIPRLTQEQMNKDIAYYSCSINTDKINLENICNLPKKNKRIAVGIIRNTNGIIYRDKDTHIHWWLYDGVHPERDFEFL